MTLIIGGDPSFDLTLMLFRSWDLHPPSMNQIVFYPNYKFTLICRYPDSFTNNSVLLVLRLGYPECVSESKPIQHNENNNASQSWSRPVVVLETDVFKNLELCLWNE